MPWSAWPVEPLTALLMIAASSGAGALVKALGGSTELSSLAGELVKALADSESRIDERLAAIGERLTAIELKLDEVLEQRYNVAMRAGVRYLLDALPAKPPSRAQDLDRARNQFIEAQSAARSSLQEAVTERYLLLCLLGLRRTELVISALIRVERLALTAALEAMLVTEYNREPTMALMRYQGSSRRQLADRDRRERAWLQVVGAAYETIHISGRLLSEAAMLGPVAGLPPRVLPALEPEIELSGDEHPSREKSIKIEHNGQIVYGGTWTVDPRGRTVDKHGQVPQGARPLLWPCASPLPGMGLWKFTIRPGETLRVGPLTAQILPGPAPETEQPWLTRGSKSQSGQHVRVDLASPLPLPLRVEVAAVEPAPSRWTEKENWSGRLLAADATNAEVPIPLSDCPGKAAACWLSISPENVDRTLIEISLQPR
jgi:hypothetical protein